MLTQFQPSAGPSQGIQAAISDATSSFILVPTSALTAGGSARRSLFGGGIYALTNAGQRAVAFLLLPLYVAVLSPAEYGRLGVLLTVQSAAATVFTAGMDVSVMRRYVQLEGDADSQMDFVLTAWSFLALTTLVLAGVVSALLVALVSTSPAFDPRQGALAVVCGALFVGATIVPLTVLRAEYELRKYIILTGILALANTALTVLFVVVLRLGVTGWLVATLAANSIALVAAIFILPWRMPTSFDRQSMGAALRIGLPLVPHAASGWSLQLADRIILASLVSVTSLGVYTLGANLALPVLVILQGLNLGFLPTYARAHSDHGVIASLRRAVNLQVAVTLAVGCAVSLLGAPFVNIFANDYSGAGVLIPWISLGYVILGLYFIPMNVISMVIGRTGFVWTLTLTAAAINIGAIYLLVPRYGIIGAAIASAVGYLALLILVSIYSRLFETRADIDWRTVAPLLSVASCIFALACVLPSHGTFGIAVRCLLLLPLGGLVLYAASIRFSEVAFRLRRFLPNG
jgi:O-antigen/teichoic acid export membrane protein